MVPKPSSASSAWPKVCPRLSRARPSEGLLLPLVGAHHAGLEGAGAQHRLRLRRAVAGDQGGAVRLAPREEPGVADQPRLGDLGIAGPQLARRQGGEGGGVGQHCARLVERADQVLALARIDPGLAAHGAVHLGEQRGRHLHERQAAQRGGGREAGEVAHHAAAERDHRGLPLHPRFQHPVDHVLQHRHLLRGLARPGRAAAWPRSPSPRGRRAAPAGAAGPRSRR